MTTPGGIWRGPAVVVGGGSGIGLAVAEDLRGLGADVLTWDVRGGDVEVDIADAEQVAVATRDTLERLGGAPSTLTITAGIGHRGRLAKVSHDDWQRVLSVNTLGVWDVMRGFMPAMKEAGGGSIVAVSSVSGRLVDKAMGVYCVSKAALDMLVRVAAREWAPEVRVNAVAPGVTDTPMLGPAPRDGEWLTGVSRRTALERLGTPGDIAQVIVSIHGLAWVTGQIIEADGGLGLTSPIDAG